jgi:hypothetical protein
LSAFRTFGVYGPGPSSNVTRSRVARRRRARRTGCYGRFDRFGWLLDRRLIGLGAGLTAAMLGSVADGLHAPLRQRRAARMAHPALRVIPGGLDPLAQRLAPAAAKVA